MSIKAQALKEGQSVKYGSWSGNAIGVYTSGGDSQGKFVVIWFFLYFIFLNCFFRTRTLIRDNVLNNNASYVKHTAKKIVFVFIVNL